MPITRRALTLATLAGASLPARAQAQPTVKLGIITALSGEYIDAAGPGSVIAVKLAVEDFVREHTPPFKIDVLAGDMLDKPDVGAGIARAWFDKGEADVVIDVPNSAVAFAIATVVKERNKVALFSATGSTALTNAQCSPNHLQWTYDTYALANGTGSALVHEGGKKWFFITADYAFGHSLQDETTRVVQANGGTVAGSAAFPFPQTTDYASFLLQAQASGADVIGLACSGNNFSNVVKQAAEFRITEPGANGHRQRLAALICLLTNVKAIGLQDAQGLVVTAPFYWDTDAATRSFANRFAPLYGGIHPTFLHAGAYSAATHYLKAVMSLGADKAKADGRAVVAEMKRLPAEDPLFGRSDVRANGSVSHPMSLYQVKAPSESKHPWDFYKKLATTPADAAFMPLSASTCRSA
ncbi:MAG: ABC transporter substrate-binding protein [Janthinobacterium lividum]